MPQINRQVRQQALHVSALPVPSYETVNSKGMPQIMDPRLVGCAVNSMDPDMHSDPAEVSLQSGHINRPAVSGDEERSAAVLRIASNPTSGSIGDQSLQ